MSRAWSSWPPADGSRVGLCEGLGSGSACPSPPRHPPALGPVAAGWAAAVTGVAIAGAIGSDTSSDWYRGLDKPSWQPPGAVFGPVWTVLYVLIAVAATLRCATCRARGAGSSPACW